MGPRTVTFPHFDCLNLGWGLCGICIFGRFNGETGGELRLEELGIIVRLPCGSLTLVPSSIVKHHNLEIATGERRYSITLYSAAELFRWVHSDFKLAPDIRRLPLSQQQQRAADDRMRKDNEWARFSKLEELIQVYRMDTPVNNRS